MSHFKIKFWGKKRKENLDDVFKSEYKLYSLAQFVDLTHVNFAVLANKNVCTTFS